MPYPDASFDCVFSSFMFHHLNSEAKDKTLREVRRVLVPGGSFHLLDFAGPDAGARGLLAHLIRSHLDDNSESRILRMMGKAGLRCSEGLVEARVLFGALIITYFHATTLTPAAAIEGLR
jgi:ubiquinone/menaquinone biosynthesis C-methylase UbiE